MTTALHTHLVEDACDHHIARVHVVHISEALVLAAHHPLVRLPHGDRLWGAWVGRGAQQAGASAGRSGLTGKLAAGRHKCQRATWDCDE